MRLQTHLALLLSLFVAVVFLIVGSSLLSWRLPRINEQARIEVQTLATEKARLLEFYLTGIEAELQPLLALTDISPVATQNVVARSIIGKGDRFLAVYLADETGIIRAGGRVGDTRDNPRPIIGADVSRTRLFNDLGDRRSAWSDKHLSSISGSVVVATALRRGRWTVIGELSPDDLRWTVAAITADTRDNILVVDRFGEWIADTGEHYAQTENLGSLPVVRAALAHTNSGQIVDTGKGTQFVGGARPSALGWTFIVTRPAGFGNPDVRRSVATIGIGFAIAIVLGLLIAPMWARMLARPLHNLIRRTHDLARGQYDPVGTVAGTERISELKQLAADLDTMAGAIREREASLARSEERLRATIENTPTVAIQWYDRDGVCRYWNPASTALYGYTAEEAVGRTLEARGFGREAHDAFVAMLRRIEVDGRAIPAIEFESRTRSGELRTVLCSIFSIPDTQGSRQFVCLDVDITERKRAEKALLESRKELESIFNASPIPMSVSDVGNECRILKVNEAWVRQFGHSPAAACGRTGNEIGLYANPEDRGRFIGRFAGGTGVFEDMELMLQRADGSRLLCRVSSQVIELGEEHLMVMVSDDITEERRMAAELRAANEELEVRVLRRTEALSRANEELAATLENLKRTQHQLLQSEKLASLGRLVAGVAHELNTPIGNGLMAITTLESHHHEFCKAFAAGLRKSTLEEFIDKVGTGVTIVTRNLMRAGELVSSFKQVAVDQASSHRRRFELKTFVDELLTTLRPMLSRSGHRVEAEVAEGIILDSYPGPIGQVLSNLIENAVLHGFDTPGTGHIRIIGTAGSDTVCLSVIDNGSGIPDEHLSRIFDPFFTTRLGQGGSGLGLHIVHNIVTGILGGQIEARSIAGEGTTLTVTIAREAPAAPAS